MSEVIRRLCVVRSERDSHPATGFGLEIESRIGVEGHLASTSPQYGPLKERLADLGQAIQGPLTNPVPKERFNALIARLEQSRLVMYPGDNCGEIVFDKLVIETIRTHYQLEVMGRGSRERSDTVLVFRHISQRL